MHREMTLKQRIGLCLAAFFMALAAQIFLSFYQSGTVLRELDDQMGNFNAISRFQNGVQQSLNALESYRWEYGDAGELLDQLHSSSSVMSAWLWRIEGDLGTVSEEQYLLYSAVCTTYDSYKELLDQLEEEVSMGRDAAAAQLYYDKVSPCGGYLRQYTQQLLNKAITDGQEDYTTVSALSDRVKWAQTIVVALCLALGSLMAREVMHLLTPVQQMIGASRDISQGSYDTPDVPVPRQDEMGQLADAFNRMKHSMAEQVNTLREKNEIERELHRQKTEALEMQNRMERSRLQQLRSQIDPHFLFNTLNVILQTAGTEKAYRTQALITALAHLLRYSLMSNDEQASGVLGSENDVLDAILGGSTSIDMSRISAFALTSYGCNKSKLLSIPFTFENRAHFWNFANSELAPEFLNEPQELGLPVRGIFYGEEGFRHFFTVKPVAGIEDFKGLKLRVSNDPVMNGMVEGLGANPTVVSFGELYSALQTGVVDGAEQPIANYKSNAFPEVANNLILDGHTLGAIQAVITDNAWGKLTENQQAAIMEAGADTQAFNAELSETAENKVLDELKASGCNVVDVPDKAPWQEACAKVISENTSDQAELYQQLLDMKG